MDVFYKSAFRKYVKKQTRPFQLALEDEIEKITSNPERGEMKKGDLSGFRTYKFNFHKQVYLVAYKVEGHTIVFYLAGAHENFYRDLKRYIKEAD
ncbi:MAG: type II toxin-antitoxin system RelE/ParE family toxin [Candidatus Tectomicrobia bacterium]|uniref:Type II toxin-antitoxin system RelE/ParE family toxin n=1 Tax=Tectimicrobiota bacterium TaxID=2528274 RepID=A0A933GMC9_UNCTE|nr:type II toxin-antitoxin system RelE/ParE family toxin [Candidatus Tectomicrobia bacterium]